MASYPKTILFSVLLLSAVRLDATSENLILNSGFEELGANAAAHWDSYVAPAEGAFAKLTPKAHSGDRAVMLHTPLPYERDPMNNWSQNLSVDLAGKKVRLSGFIATHDATEAMLWAQCWRKSPWGVLKTFSTSRDCPVYGDSDWQEVSVEFSVPEGVAFLTVRAVLKGIGTAYFDDISLEVLENEEAVKKKTAPTPDATPKANAPLLKAGSLSGVERELSRLRDANLALAEALQAMRDQNMDLRQELQAIQKDLQSLREVATPEASITSSEEDAQNLDEAMPPWRPHREDGREGL